MIDFGCILALIPKTLFALFYFLDFDRGTRTKSETDRTGPMANCIDTIGNDTVSGVNDVRPSECRLHKYCALAYESNGSGMEDFGVVELLLCNNVEQEEFYTATATTTFNKDVATMLQPSYDCARIANIRRYKAWVGARSLHIS